jgi:choline dehydrogenase-like flavoprotein
MMDYLHDADDLSWPKLTGGGWHHMGSTRMTDDSKKGVVDSNCKVHTLGNLYVAGSSCFATAGAVNPTLTLVALTLRLSDHLKVTHAM